MDTQYKPKSAEISVAATAILCVAVTTLLVVMGTLAWWFWVMQHTTEWSAVQSLIIAGCIVWLALLSLLIMGFIASRLLIRDKLNIPLSRRGKSVQPAGEKAAIVSLKKHLRRRYNLMWRRKVKLLLITGDDSAIEQLVPGLAAQQWLEGQGTVLIYGGSLQAELIREKFFALRRLHSGRPLDGIVRVLMTGATYDQQTSDHDLRSLEKVSEWLRYSPPVWLWQLCHSDWGQAQRSEQAVGVSFSRRAQATEISQQLQRLLPGLCRQGICQLAENNRYDFLLRLGQQLKNDGVSQYVRQLTPWLYGSQPHIWLRGLMFSLATPAERGTEVSAGQEQPSSDFHPHPHRLGLSPVWQGIIDDCGRISGKPPLTGRRQVMAATVFTLVGIWTLGMLVSFVLNRHLIATVAQHVGELSAQPQVSDSQLSALYELRNDAGRLHTQITQGTPWYQRFGLNHHQPLLNAMLPWYTGAANRLIRDPAKQALEQHLSELVNTEPESVQRQQRVKLGYEQLKALLMMSSPDNADAAFFARTMLSVQPQRPGISTGLWQSLAPDLWAFYMSELPRQAQWKIQADSALIAQSRQLLLQQMGRRNAEATLYQSLLKSVRLNFADVSLEDMTAGTDARRLFTTDRTVPGMFTRQAWEGGVQQAIAKAASSRRDQIDWVLSDNRQSVSAELSPETLKARLTERYFTDFAASWLEFLNGLRWVPANTIADVTDQLTLMSDSRQSPLIALMNTVAWQGQSGQQAKRLSESLVDSAKQLVSRNDEMMIDQSAQGPQGPLDETFGPLLSLMGRNTAVAVMSADSSLSLQTYLTRITQVRLRLQQVAAAADPRQMMQTLAQTVFRGNSVDLTDTRQYGSLIAASLGEEWSGFGGTVFIQPLTQAWETVLQPSAASLNNKWKRSVVANWQSAFDGRFPFTASNSEVSLPMLAEFIRKDSGRIERFLSTELGGVLQKEGSQWVVDNVNSQGLTFNPAFLRAINQLSQLSDILFTDGSQGISFELQPRAVGGVTETQLVIDGQTLRYYNQLAEWQSFRWPGESYKPGTMLTWTTTRTGTRLFGDYNGSWGFIRWLEQGKRQQIDRSQWMMSFTAADGSTLQWVLRTQLGNGPLALLGLRDFRLPDAIFSVDLQPPEPVSNNQNLDIDES